jgi:hypothetical protein
MAEGSRRPKRSPEQLPEEAVCGMVRLKLAHLSWGPRKIRELYLRRHGEVASESTFKRVLERGRSHAKAASAPPLERSGALKQWAPRRARQ